MSVGVVVSVRERQSLDKSEHHNYHENQERFSWVDVFKGDSKPKFVTFFIIYLVTSKLPYGLLFILLFIQLIFMVLYDFFLIDSALLHRM